MKKWVITDFNATRSSRQFKGGGMLIKHWSPLQRLSSSTLLTISRF